MFDSNDLLNSMKKAAVQAVDASKPTAVVFGTVTSILPLKINVEQKVTLMAPQLILTRNVTDYVVNMTGDHLTEWATHTHDILDSMGKKGSAAADIHQHSYTGTKVFVVHNGLMVEDQVVLLRMQGGQKFIVLDRVVAI